MWRWKANLSTDNNLTVRQWKSLIFVHKTEHRQGKKEEAKNKAIKKTKKQKQEIRRRKGKVQESERFNITKKNVIIRSGDVFLADITLKRATRKKQTILIRRCIP